ncbi:MAG: gliding motility-associated C-terminal domain-containing protein [Muribaculaceae bacterium]|nr:gliding motility-associated C-terminal domain-containing protein [Muribaculaceae bacterium]
MRKLFPALILLLASHGAHALDFEGAAHPVVSETPAASTGLQAVFVAPSTQGLTMVYTARSASSAVRWYRFSTLGGAYAEELTPTRSGARVTLAAQSGDMGYIIEEGTDRYCYWLVDYSEHHLVLDALDISPEQDCARAVLELRGEASEIPYYTINGRRMLLSRGLELSYTAESFDDDAFAYVTSLKTETIDGVDRLLAVDGAYCSTGFELAGDRFLRAWGDELSVTSPVYNPIGVDATTRATQATREVDNEQREDAADGLGGSAPCDIIFEAAVTEGAVFREWQISRSPEFSVLENSFNELAFDYTFTEQGTTYVRFTANNDAGTCEYIGETYQVFIGESKLEIPNAFSPEASPGVNDEWRVSYKSIVSYECHIFNRWGTQMFSSTNPAEGWDGKYRGKYVPAGVYFYVIKARGADGVEYEKAGDINIIKYRQGSGAASAPAD